MCNAEGKGEGEGEAGNISASSVAARSSSSDSSIMRAYWKIAFQFSQATPTQPLTHAENGRKQKGVKKI